MRFGIKDFMKGKYWCHKRSIGSKKEKEKEKIKNLKLTCAKVDTNAFDAAYRL